MPICFHTYNDYQHEWKSLNYHSTYHCYTVFILHIDHNEAQADHERNMYIYPDTPPNNQFPEGSIPSSEYECCAVKVTP